MASESGADRRKDVKPLFPVVLSEQTDTSRQSLFPVISATSTNVTSGNNLDNDLDWLENKSFIPTSLLLAQEESSRPTASQGITSSSPETSVKRELGSARQSSSDGEEEDAHHTEIKPLKRSLSESESDEESLPANKIHKSPKHHDNSGSREGKKHKKKKKKKKHKHKEGRSRSPAEDSKDSKPEDPSEFWRNQTTKTFLQEIPGLKPEFAFRLDRKAEKSLWNYESVYKGHIARYRRLTDQCLGNTDVQLGDRKKDRGAPCRYYSKENRKQVRGRGCSVPVDKHVENKTAEYIPVRDKDEGHERSPSSGQTNPLGLLDNTTNLYVQGKGPATKEEIGEETVVDETMERIAFYNRQLQDNPGNVKLWTEFVSFQDQVFRDARFSAESVAKRRMKDVFQPPRACIEKKLAILEKALAANPSSLDLKLMKLEVEQDVSDPSSLAKEWDNLLFVHAGDVRLWRSYLTFQQARLGSFTVGRLVKLYHRCFRTLGPILEGRVKVMTTTETLEEDVMGVFEQYCLFLHQSGFTEKAVASYQALVEFNLFRPSSLNLTPTHDSAAVFESFWDSGVARFGERGAKGWASWVDAAKSSTVDSVGSASTEEEQETILKQDLPAWQTWLKIERLRQSVHWLPWRPDSGKGETEEDCEDLDRLVLYEDVAPVLLRLQQSASFCRLVLSFLDLLGLAQQQGGREGGLHFDQLKLSALCQVPSASSVGVNIQTESSWQPHGEIVSFVEEVLRQSAAYFTSYQRTVLNCQLLRLQTEKHGCRDASLLSEKAAKDVRKFGKSLLKEVQNRNDLLLWDAYIRNEWAFGKVKDAMSMLQTALAMFTASADSDDHAGMAGLCSLYRTLAEIYLSFTPLELVSLTSRKPSPSPECKNKAVSGFSCLMDRTRFSASKGEAVPAAQVLRTRRKFQSTMTDLLSDSASLSSKASAARHAVLVVNCFALFELCAAGFTESVQVFDTALQLCTAAVKKHSSSQVKHVYTDVEKDLYHTLLSMLQNYMALNAVSMGMFRSHLATALSRFPDDAWFLCQFVGMEMKTFLAGRLRRYFEAASQDPASVFPVLFGVLAELGRHCKLVEASASHAQGQGCVVSEGGMVHRVRAACERGVQCKAAQHCPLLWRMYLAFEAQYGSMDRAKGIFYRALQSCPWAKVLYMDGAALFGEQQLQELVDLMTEKELRVQIPLEEVELLMSSEPLGPEDGGEEEEAAGSV
ncbi:nuclear exosome regulator NRDE2-like [Babylonia areolata]|uniref:nuclear exosome regulator NRDE2-like n=1 Tax=Babylonia areolata TaxID=304850 RepID=UPI003FCF0B49